MKFIKPLLSCYSSAPWQKIPIKCLSVLDWTISRPPPSYTPLPLPFITVTSCSSHFPLLFKYLPVSLVLSKNTCPLFISLLWIDYPNINTSARASAIISTSTKKGNSFSLIFKLILPACAGSPYSFSMHTTPIYEPEQRACIAVTKLLPSTLPDHNGTVKINSSSALTLRCARARTHTRTYNKLSHTRSSGRQFWIMWLSL